MPKRVHLVIDGEPVTVAPGTTVAAAVWNRGTRSFRRSVDGSFRAPVCGMGVCFECRLAIDGRAGERSCIQLCREGMVVETAEKTVPRGENEADDG